MAKLQVSKASDFGYEMFSERYMFQNCNDARQSIRLSTAFCQMSLAVLQLRHTPILILAQFSSYFEQVLKIKCIL